MADRDEHGRFLKGHDIGKETRFDFDNAAAVKYKDEYADKIVAWFAEKAELDADYPTFERFAREIGVIHETMREWAKHFARFRSAYEACKDIQREVLAVRTLGRMYEPSFAKFLAINNLGMVDQTSVQVQGDTDKPLAVDIRIVD